MISDTEVTGVTRAQAVVTVASRVMMIVQRAIDGDTTVRHIDVMYEVSAGVTEYIRVIMQTKWATTSYMWEPQILIDMRIDAVPVIEAKVTALIADLVKLKEKS